MTRTDRRRFPILLAAIAALAMTLLFSPVQAQEGSAPDKPTGLSATASHDQVVLTWDDPQDDTITGYVILRRVRENDVGGKFSELAPDTGSTATTYTDDSVAANTTYTYRIKALNEHGVSERSRWFHIDIPAAPVPDKPTGLAATASHDRVVLTWDDPGDDSITGYVILRRVRENDIGGEFSELVADTGSASTTYTDATVKADTTYTYRIKATNEHGVSERSRWFHIDIPAAPERPDKPTGLDATATHDQVVLTWDDPNDDSITGYVILRRNRQTTVSGQFSELVADTGSAATTYTDDSVAAETNYTYRIKAINEHGVSERSRWFHIDTPAAPEAVEGDDQDEQDGEDDDDGAPGHATPPDPGGRANVSEPDGEDLPGDTTTTGEVDVGGSVTGNIGSFADADYFRVVLEAGTRYQIDLEGAPTGRGTLADPALTLYDESENNLLDDDTSGIGANSRVIFTPTTAGTYYLRVEDSDETDTGTYTLSVIVLGANGASEADTDFPDTTSTSGRVEVGASVTGNISNGDYDYFRVDLEAGKTYQFDLEGADSGRGTLVDPFLSLYDGSATFLLTDDDSGTNLNSQMVYNAASAGAHYLRAASGAGNLTGTYTLSVSGETPILSTDATLSGLSLGTGVTLSPAFASGTVTYTASVTNSVDEVTVTPTTNHASATVEILDTDDKELDDADNMEDDFQVALSVGDTVIKVKVTAEDSSSTQTYTVTVTRDDFPNDNTTTGEVEVGGTVTGNIGTVGDYDRFKVELEAGTRYQLDLEGADTGRGTLADPHLGLYDNIGSHLQGDNGQLGDDNSGVGANARMIYTPDASGDFYPVATEINDNLTGAYTLSVILLGANGASEADTDFPADNTTSGRVEVGASATGNIGIANDYDWFRVDLEAGKTYQFDLKGIGGGGGTLENPYLLNIRDSSGTEIDGTENDDVDPSDDIYDSQTVYTPTAAGSYYLVAVSGVTGGTGSYTLSVRDITTPPCTLNTGDIWCGAVAVGELKSSADVLVGHGFADGAGLSAGGLAGYPDDTMFSVGDNDYTISAAYIQVPTGTNPTGTLYVLLSADLTDDDKAGLGLTVDDTTTTFEFSGATKGSTGLYSWGQSGLSWSAGDTVTIRVRPRTLSVADASDAENDAEVEFTVTLSEAAAEEVTATWTASIAFGDTAAAADLGSTKTGTVTVAIGDTTETFTVPVVNDASDEGDETFTVTLSSPSTNAKLETDPTAKGTIEDDDPTPTVTVANASATEGDAVEFVVTLSAVSGRDVYVDYATSVATGDDATAGVDFTTKSGTLTIAAADNTATGTIEVQTTDDDASESAETFTLTISNPDNATLTTDTTATGTINNRATAAVALVGNTTQTTTFEQTTVASISFAVGFQTGDDAGGYALTALDLMFSAKPVVPVTVSLWDGYRPGGNDDGDDDWRPNNKYFEFDNPSAFKDGNNQINSFTPPEPFYLHDDRVYFVVIESDGSGSTEYYMTNTDADGQSRVDSDWWILNSAVRYQDLSNPDGPWSDSVTQTPTRIPVFTIHGYDLDRLTYTTSESDQDNFKVGEDNYNWWAQNFNAIPGSDSFIGFKLHSVALALEYIASADSGIPDSPDEISVSLYTGKQEGGPSSDWVPDEKLFDFRDPPAFREGSDNAFTAPEGTRLRPQGRYAIVIQRHSGGWIRLRNTASNEQRGNSNLFVDNESQKSRDGTNWSGENWVVKMLVYGKQRTEAIPLSTGPTTLSGLSLGTGVTLSPAFASGTVTYTASVANSVDEVTVTPTTNHASATVEILDTDDKELDDANDMEDDFQVALSVGDTVIKVKVTAEDSTSTQTYTVTVTRDDFPNDNTTTGEVEVGGRVTGNIGTVGDYDRFRVELEADTRYQLDLEGADTGRGTLSDPDAIFYDASAVRLVADNDSGVGNNARMISTPTASGTHYVQASGPASGDVTGTYTLSVILLGANGASEADTDFPADNTTSGRVEVGASATGNIASTPDKDWFRVDLEAGKVYQIDLEGGPTGRGTLLDPYLTLFDGSGNLIENNDDISTANLNSQLVFTPTAAGTYYLVVETAATTTGTYTLSVRDITLPTLSIADAEATEGDDMEFTVTLSAAAAATVTATWTASIETGDTAFAADLGATKTGTVEITAGDTDATITVATVEDTTVEVNETFTVTLSSPSSNAKLETDPTATGTIEDDAAMALSTDATLSDLSLGTGVTLNPAFASGTVTYTASVANSVDEVTVTPTTNHASATVEILDTDDKELDDADNMEDDFQVALSVGDTVIKVKVTAEDGTSTQTYTVTVTRAAEMTPDDPPDDSGNVPEPVTDLLSNLGQANNLNFAIAVGDFENAQGFTTGSDSYGYFLASINLDVDTVPRTPADVTVSLWSATSDSPPEPDAPVATLTHSTGTWATGVNTFNAPGGTALDPGTTYFVVQSYSGARAHLSLRLTASGSADDDSTGWSVAGARLTRSRTDLGDWSGQSGEYTKFSVSGAAVPAQGVAEGATDLPADTSTGGVVEVGGAGARGFIHEPIGTSTDISTTSVPEISTSYDLDTDWFAVELEAGKTYRIDMKGAILTSPGPNNYADPELTLLLPQINAIYDADGDYLLNTWGEDESSAHHLFRVTFHAHAGGTYYIAASGESFEWGGYELTVIEITEDTD